MSDLSKLEKIVNNPNLWDDRNRALTTQKNYKNLSKRLSLFQKSKLDINDLTELLDISDSTNDLQNIQTSLEELERTITNLMQSVLFDNDDDNGCFLEIIAGSGGQDSQDFAKMLLRMYMRYCDNANFKLYNCKFK